MVLPTVGEGDSRSREREREETKSSDTDSGMKCFLPLLTEMLSGFFRGNFTDPHSFIYSFIFTFSFKKQKQKLKLYVILNIVVISVLYIINYLYCVSYTMYCISAEYINNCFLIKTPTVEVYHCT